MAGKICGVFHDGDSEVHKCGAFRKLRHRQVGRIEPETGIEPGVKICDQVRNIAESGDPGGLKAAAAGPEVTAERAGAHRLESLEKCLYVLGSGRSVKFERARLLLGFDFNPCKLPAPVRALLWQ